MKTKKFYSEPEIRVVKMKSMTLLAGSNEDFGASGSVSGSDDGGDAGGEWTN